VVSDARREIPWACHGGNETALVAVQHTETGQVALAVVDSECVAYAFDRWYAPASDVWESTAAAPRQAAMNLLSNHAADADGAVVLSRVHGKLRVTDWVEL
jgi:hypothetical protein